MRERLSVHVHTAYDHVLMSKCVYEHGHGHGHGVFVLATSSNTMRRVTPGRDPIPVLLLAIYSP
jgi:hypothetical protein